ENNVPRYDPLTGNLENSAVFSRAGKVGVGMAEPTEKLEVVGNMKATGKTITKAVELANETGTPLPNQITRNGNKPQYTDSAGVTKGLVKVHTSVLTDKIAVMTADDEIKPATFSPGALEKVYGEDGDGVVKTTEVVAYKAIDTSLSPPDLAQ